MMLEFAEVLGKTIGSCTVSANDESLLIRFTDGTEMTLIACCAQNEPWIEYRIATGILHATS
jgi:hypothetical protein